MTLKLIPAIDIIDGGLVRLYKGDYSKKTTYDQSPVEMALHYQSLGFKQIHVVDLNGAKNGSLVNINVIKAIAESTQLNIQVGGGIRSMDHVYALFECGVANVIIGSLFVKDYELAIEIVQAFPKKIIAGLDILNGRLASHGWTEQSSIELNGFLSKLADQPLHAIITTDISKDGTFEGLNLDLYRKMATLTHHLIIASGGVSSIQDVQELKNLNCPNIVGCIVGKAIIEGKISQHDVIDYL